MSNQSVDCELNVLCVIKQKPRVPKSTCGEAKVMYLLGRVDSDGDVDVVFAEGARHLGKQTPTHRSKHIRGDTLRRRR